MLIAERVKEYLLSRKPAPLCDACIATHLDLRHQQANRVTMALGITSDFERDHGTCADCKRQQKVTVADGFPYERKVDAFHRHEVLHTASIASDFFDRHLTDHVAVVADPELKAAADRISEALADFYQLCGAKFTDGESGAVRKVAIGAPAKSWPSPDDPT